MKKGMSKIGCIMVIGTVLAGGGEGLVLEPVLPGTPQRVAPSSLEEHRIVPHRPESGGTGSERIVPHAVSPQEGVSQPKNGDTAFPHTGSVPTVQNKKRAGVLRRYLNLINRRLELTRNQKRRIRKIVNERKELLKKINRRFSRMQRRYSALPSAGSFMGRTNFDLLQFEMEMEMRTARLAYLKKERRRRVVRWMGETLKRVVKELTPEQRRNLIRLTRPRP